MSHATWYHLMYHLMYHLTSTKHFWLKYVIHNTVPSVFNI